MTASPFGFGPLPQINPEDLARLFQEQSMSAPQGFVPPQTTAASAPQPVPQAAPARPFSLGGKRGGTASAVMTVPLPPQRPAEFGDARADMPAEGGQPIMAAEQVHPPVAEEPSLLDRLARGIRSTDGLLTSIGMGLMSNPNWGQGVATGIAAHQQGEGRRAASRLAEAEYGLKASKLLREQNAENQTAKFIQSKVPGITSEQAQAFAGNSAFVNELMKGVVPPQEIYRQFTDGDGNVWSQNSRTGQSTVALQAKDERTAEQKDYEAAKREGFTGNLTDFINLKGNANRAQTTINNAVNPVLKGLGEQFVEGAGGARSSADAVRSIRNARSQLDAPGGIYSGAFAENHLALQKLGSFLGVADPSAIQNTETFRTQIKPIVLDTVKGLGAGSGISNADRDFALQAVGGDIKLDEGTIRRVLDITERSARSKITRYNEMAAKMLETQPELRQVLPMLQVDMPEGEMPAAPTPTPKRLRFDPTTGGFR